MDYQVKIAQFEGPFDLILYFIERDEINIYDIPIANVTNEFLEYIKQMNELNVDLASDFIVVAASLMRIKAKMLLPRKELDEQGQEIDPRQELVQRLLEYKRFKSVIEDMALMAEERKKLHGRGSSASEISNIAEGFSSEMDLESINLFKLMNVFNKVVERMNDRKAQEVRHQVVRYPYTIDEQKETILNYVNSSDRVSFEECFDTCRDKIEAVYRFLALLDLVQEKILNITVGLGVNNFWLSTYREEEAA